MRKQLILALILCFLILTSYTIAQRSPVRSVQNNDKMKLDVDKPGVYIRFEKYGLRKPLREREGNNGIWLKLTNNFQSPIGFCAFGISKEGRQLIGFTKDTEIGVKYDIELSVKHTKFQFPDGIPIGYNTGSTCLMYQLKSGTSLVFSVPEEHLAVGLSIKLAFLYDWENIFEGEPEHFVKFRSSDLPKK